MRLNNRKIDYILKLMFYLMPVLYIFIVALATESPTLVNFTSQLNAFIGDIGNSFIFADFVEWFTTNLSTNNGVIFVLNYSFYIVLVEFVLLFKNILTWLFKVANQFIERSFIND